MTTVRLAILATLGVSLLGGGCGSHGAGDGAATSPTVAAVTDAEPCDQNLAVAPPARALTWEDILPTDIPAPDGWSVAPDTGEGPFLVVPDGAQAVGSLELGQLALESDFDPEQGFAALDVWAQIEEDRRATSGGFAVFEAFSVDEVPFGSFCGVSYGFSVLDRVTQTASKLFLGYATFDRANLYIVTAFYDEDHAADPGFRDEASLQTYSPFLEQLVAQLKMPPDG